MATKKTTTPIEYDSMTDKEKIMASVERLLAHKRQMSLDERREKFGMAADCDMVIVNRLCAITVDNPLPDDDMAILITNVEKVVDVVIGVVGKRFVDESKGVKFFEE